MIKVATAINSFAPVAQQAQESPSEPIFVLSSSQLQEIISRAVQPLQDEVSQLKATITRQDEKIRASESTHEQDMNRLAFDIANDRKRISEVERRSTTSTPPKGDKTLARIAMIDDILKVKGSITFKELEKLLKIRPQEMSRIIARMDKRRYDVFLRDGDDRQKVLRLKAKIR